MRHLAISLILACGIAAAATPEQEAALREIEAFSLAQQRTDPLYPVVEGELLKRIDGMISSQPAASWAPSIKQAYFGLSEKAHAEERAKIRGAERAAIGGVVAPSPKAADAYIDRLEALEKDLVAGKLSPRVHALHALEAAQAIFPADAHLIALRETKVVLASQYELGSLSRPEYDERWARARSDYQQRADARQQALQAGLRAEQAAGPAGASAADIFRQLRGITCTTQGAATTCR